MLGPLRLERRLTRHTSAPWVLGSVLSFSQSSGSPAHRCWEYWPLKLSAQPGPAPFPRAPCIQDWSMQRVIKARPGWHRRATLKSHCGLCEGRIAVWLHTVLSLASFTPHPQACMHTDAPPAHHGPRQGLCLSLLTPRPSLWLQTLGRGDQVQLCHSYSAFVSAGGKGN